MLPPPPLLPLEHEHKTKLSEKIRHNVHTFSIKRHIFFLFLELEILPPPPLSLEFPGNATELFLCYTCILERLRDLRQTVNEHNISLPRGGATDRTMNPNLLTARLNNDTAVPATLSRGAQHPGTTLSMDVPLSGVTRSRLPGDREDGCINDTDSELSTQCKLYEVFRGVIALLVVVVVVVVIVRAVVVLTVVMV